MKKWKILLLTIWIFVISIPLLVGILHPDEDLVYGGLIFNPIDGYSYLAKMQQGFYGEWAFQLPYSANETSDIFIFTFYILLGHIARITGIGIPVIFHIFRIGISILCFFALDSLLKIFFEKDEVWHKFALISLLFGGGLGWIYLFTGDLPIDLWVSEAYIFLSSFSNPHFILTFLIFCILIKILFKNEKDAKSFWIFFLLGFLLSNISPFGAVNIGFLMVIILFFTQENRRLLLLRLVSFGFPTLLIGIYQFTSIKNDTVLKIWNDQNLTLTPGIGNLIFGFSPFLVGIIILVIMIYKKRIEIPPLIKILMAWVFLLILLSYIPVNLQRRFLVGLYLPMGIIFWKLLSLQEKAISLVSGKVFPVTLLGLSLFSNLLIFSGSVNALMNQDRMFYIDKNVEDAINWIKANDQGKRIILAKVDTGLVIPALGNFRVIYGHPFESINAEKMNLMVNEFWSNKLTIQEQLDLIIENNVDFILCEVNSGLESCPKITSQFNTIYDTDNILLFQVEN